MQEIDADIHSGQARNGEPYDVAIVGYGPVGQALALKLAQYGHHVVVIERWPTLYGLPRAVGLDHEAMRILQSMGVADELAAYTTSSQVYEWRNGEGELLVAFPGMDQLAASGWPLGNGFSQPTLEYILDARLRNAHPGQVDVLRGITVSALAEADQHVVLKVQGAAAQAQPDRIMARYVVGCDGAGSTVRQAMGVQYQDLAFAADWLVVDVQPRDPAQCGTELIQLCDPRRPTTMVTGGPGRRRFEFMMLEGERKEDFNNPTTAWSLLRRWGWTPENAVLERHAVYTFRASIAERWRQDRMMIAGDAAHLTPPFAAQGLCAGLRDVAALSWRLDMVLRGRAPETLLDSYSDERRAHARALVEFAVELGRIICVLDPEAARARDAQLRAQAETLARQTMPAPRLGDSPLVNVQDPAAGTLAIQGRVRRHGREGRFDEFSGHGFVLLGHGHDPSQSLDATQRAFLQSIGATTLGIGPGCAMQDVNGSYRRWFEQLGARAVLVRPDFYLLGAGEAHDLVDTMMRAWKTHDSTRADRDACRCAA